MTMPHATLRPPVEPEDHQLGDAAAPVTLVEYGDYECPHCARAHPIVATLRRRLGDRLRFVFRDFPLTEIHPHALHAAAATASVAQHQGEAAYWRMHDAIFEHQRDSRDALDDAHLATYAAAIGADPVQVRMDLDAGVHEPRVRQDFLSGVRSGVNGTPTFFVNGVRFDGNWTDVEAFAIALERAALAAV